MIDRDAEIERAAKRIDESLALRAISLSGDQLQVAATVSIAPLLDRLEAMEARLESAMSAITMWEEWNPSAILSHSEMKP